MGNSINRLDTSRDLTPPLDTGHRLDSFERITGGPERAGLLLAPTSHIPEPDPAIMAFIREQLSKLGPQPVHQAAKPAVQAAAVVQVTKDIAADAPEQLQVMEQGVQRRMDNNVQTLEVTQADTATKAQNDVE